MALFNRYPGGAGGIRLDNEDNPQEGRALDLMGYADADLLPLWKLWVRSAGGEEATVDALDVDDLIALRDGLNGVLHRAGVERQITINVPGFFEVRAHDRHNADGSVTHVRAHRRTPR